jgi:hypothetical protein
VSGPTLYSPHTVQLHQAYGFARGRFEGMRAPIMARAFVRGLAEWARGEPRSWKDEAMADELFQRRKPARWGAVQV